MTRLQKGVSFIILSQLLWGFGPLTIKLLSPSIPASLVVLVRFYMASGILFLFALTQTRARAQLFGLSKNHLIHIILFGILGSGIADLFFTSGVRGAGALTAGVLSRLEIPFTVLLAWILLKEKISTRIIIATIASFSGVMLLSMKNGTSASTGSYFHAGVAFATTAAFIWGCTNVYGKALINMKLLPVVMIAIRMFVGATCNLIIFFLSADASSVSLGSISALDWLKLTYLGIGASALAYFSFYKGLELMPASQASNFMGVSLAIAVLSGIFIGERLMPLQWFGVLAIVVGIYLVIAPHPREEYKKNS